MIGLPQLLDLRRFYVLFFQYWRVAAQDRPTFEIDLICVARPALTRSGGDGGHARTVWNLRAATCERLPSEKGLGDLRTPAAEHVIGLDGSAVIVHPNSALRSLDLNQMRRLSRVTRPSSPAMAVRFTCTRAMISRAPKTRSSI
jgi:hypothetical protein